MYIHACVCVCVAHIYVCVCVCGCSVHSSLTPYLQSLQAKQMHARHPVPHKFLLVLPIKWFQCWALLPCTGWSVRATTDPILTSTAQSAAKVVLGQNSGQQITSLIHHL